MVMHLNFCLHHSTTSISACPRATIPIRADEPVRPGQRTPAVVIETEAAPAEVATPRTARERVHRAAGEPRNPQEHREHKALLEPQ